MSDQGFKSLGSLNDIPELKYSGYVRMSDETENRLVSPETPFDFKAVGKSPFVIEANLYAEEDETSISVRQIDGEYIIGHVDWKDVSDSNPRRKLEYQGGGFPGSNKVLLFEEAWLPFKDELCENMEVLKPVWVAFKGFKT